MPVVNIPITFPDVPTASEFAEAIGAPSSATNAEKAAVIKQHLTEYVVNIFRHHRQQQRAAAQASDTPEIT